METLEKSKITFKYAAEAERQGLGTQTNIEYAGREIEDVNEIHSSQSGFRHFGLFSYFHQFNKAHNFVSYRNSVSLDRIFYRSVLVLSQQQI